MKKLLYIAIFGFLTFFISSCRDKEECIDDCGTFQTCVEGECKCPENMFTIDEKCITKRENYFIGVLECGCLNDIIMSLALEESNLYQVLDGTGSKTGDLHSMGNDKYSFTMGKGCIFDKGNSNFIDFTLEKVDENNLLVKARWWSIELGTLSECSSIFAR